MKSVLKKIANIVALCLVFPLVVLYWAFKSLFGADKVFQGWSQAVSLWPGLIGVYLRRAFYRCVLGECGAGSWIGFGTIISHPTARIGTKVYVGPFCSLGDVTLEEDVLLGSHVSIMNGSSQHGTDRVDIPIREQPGSWPHITIGRNTWIGDRAIVMAAIGKNCVIGAGSLVTKPIPDFAVAVGVPAKVVRFRNEANGLAANDQSMLPASDPG
jgi:virginiamycin A acetyltransferase